ncbi:hypothetical protein ID866_7812 [Astraeus odoratus]|nr:hypothetical protein ID866_7812 [Astraeus odoratus]
MTTSSPLSEKSNYSGRGTDYHGPSSSS